MKAPPTAAPALIALLVLVAAVSGCLGAPDATPGAPGAVDAPATPPTGDATTGQPEGAPDLALPRLSSPIDDVWYFTAEPGLAREPPETGRVNVAIGPQDLVLGMSVVEFASPPLAAPMLVHAEAITLTLYFASEGPMVSNGVFDVAAWGGSSRSMPLFAFVAHAPANAPGVIEVELTLDFADQRGVVLEAGDSLRFLLAYGYQHPREAGTVQLLTGGDEGSRIAMRSSAYNEPPFAGALSQPDVALAGELTHAFAPTDCDAAPGVTSQEHEIVLPPEAAWIAIESKATTTTTPVADVDIDLYHAGTRVAGSHTPYDDERILLGAETLAGLAGETLTLKVGTCGAGRIAYEVVVRHAVWPAAGSDEQR